MSINDLPTLAALRTKMQWHQARQKVLSENVSNSDTPNFKPRDLVEPKFEPTGGKVAGFTPLAMARTTSGHMASSGDAAAFDVNGKVGFETRPAGNAVSLEEEMTKVAANQMDYVAITSLYSKSMALLKTAIGK